MDNDKISVGDPALIVALVAAFFGDIGFILIIPHYLCGGIAVAMFWHKTKGFIPKAILLFVLIIPLPLLTIGVILAVLMSNKFIAFLIEQAAIQTVAVATAGAGEALEGVAAAEAGAEVAEVGVEAAEGAQAAAEGAEAAGAAGEAAGAGAEAAEGAEAGAEAREGAEAAEGDEAYNEALGEKPETMEELQNKYFEESPEEKMEQAEEEEEGPEPEEKGEKESDATKKLREAFKKAQEVARKQKEITPQQQATTEDEEDTGQDEEIDQAA